jgi:hypothetical protein
MTTNTTITPELLDQLLANHEKPEDLEGGWTRVAAPPRGGQENLDAHTNGASRRRHALVGSADGTGTTLHKDRHPGQPMSVVLHN